MSAEEVPLPGGDVTEGVVQVGATVRRPQGSHTPMVHAVLRHLEAVGFTGAPRVLGIDDKGREILTFVEGEVAGRPWPEWVGALSRATSVARLVRELDDAMLPLGVVAPDGSPVASKGAERFMGHRDITPENTVFRDGEAYALIDFDLAKPSTRGEEVANVLQWWAPWCAPEDRNAVFAGLDVVARGREIVDAYGLDYDARLGLVDLTIDRAEQSWHGMKANAETIGGGWARMWEEGAGDSIRRRQNWLRANRDELTNSLVRH